MTNATGATQQESTYYAFGSEQRVITNTVSNQYKFTGLERDAESGLDHTLYRKFTSNLARWLSPDPVAGDALNPQSLNRYSYVLNNPTNFTDPLGLYIVYPPDPTPPRSGGHVIDSRGCDPSIRRAPDYCGDSWMNMQPLDGLPGGCAYGPCDGGGGYGGETVDDSGAPIVIDRALSEEGLDFLTDCEGFRSKPYNDTGGNCTVGYGHLLHKGGCNGEEAEVTRDQAAKLLSQDVAAAGGAVNGQINAYLNQPQFDSMTSFTYNVGEGRLASSTLRRHLNAGNYDAVPRQMGRFVYSGGQVSPGLQTRRRAEGNIFATGAYGGCHE